MTLTAEELYTPVPGFDNGSSIGLPQPNYYPDVAKAYELAVVAGGAKARIMEIGTYTGRTALAMARSGAEVVCVDTWEDERLQLIFEANVRRGVGAGLLKEDQVAAHRGTSSRAANSGIWIGSSPYDMVYIDSIHTAEHVYQDITEWLPHLRAGGIMAGHDINTPTMVGGIRRAMAQADINPSCLDMIRIHGALPPDAKDEDHSVWGGVWWFRKPANARS